MDKFLDSITNVVLALGALALGFVLGQISGQAYSQFLNKTTNDEVSMDFVVPTRPTPPVREVLDEIPPPPPGYKGTILEEYIPVEVEVFNKGQDVTDRLRPDFRLEIPATTTYALHLLEDGIYTQAYEGDGSTLWTITSKGIVLLGSLEYYQPTVIRHGRAEVGLWLLNDTEMLTLVILPPKDGKRKYAFYYEQRDKTSMTVWTGEIPASGYGLTY